MQLMHRLARRRADAAKQSHAPRRARLAVGLVTLASTALIGGGALAGTASAGVVPIAQCGLNAAVTLAPALTTTTHTVGGNMQGTLSNCSLNGAALPGTGQFFANSLTGPASTASESLTGQATVIWPASANLNASIGNFTINVNAQGVATYSGTILAGAFKGQHLRGQYHIELQSTVIEGGTKTTVQNVFSFPTTPLQVLVNFG
jgi:hypothetical protein